MSIDGYLLPDGDMRQVSLTHRWVSNDPQIGVEAESLPARDVDSTDELASQLPDLAQRLARRAGMRKAISDRVPYGDTDLIPSMVSDTQVRMEWGGRYRHRETVVFDLSDPEGMFAPEIRTAYGDVRVDGADRELVVSGFGRELLMAQDRFDLLGRGNSARVAYDHVADLFAHARAADPIGGAA